MSPDPTLSTGSSFPPVSEAEWREDVAKVLKGGSFDTLRTPTLDGYTIEPIYTRATTAVPVPTHRRGKPWIISQRIDHPDHLQGHHQLMAHLHGGGNGLDLVFFGSPHARGYGLTAETPADITALLADVIFDIVQIRVGAGDDTLRLANLVVDHIPGEGQPGGDFRLNLTTVCDPIGTAAARGGSVTPLAGLVSDTCANAAKLAARQPGGPVLNADGRIWHEAGASRTQTLAAMLATAVAYWRGLEAAGLSIEDAAGQIGFTLAIDQNQFSSIAEIRALRLLWARATAAAGITAPVARIHAETSLRMMSRLDVNTNLIRSTIAAFAAAIGGADSLSVLPYSSANGLPDDFARRLARNTQLLLLEESNLHRVADPAAGSGRVEAEAEALARAAWDLFREIEAEGGIVESLTSGKLQSRIEATSAARAKDIARRKLPLTGASEYPILTQAEVAVLDIEPIARPAIALAQTIPTLTSRRLSEPFERLRDTAATAALQVFLANLGSTADFSVRSTWVKNLFEVGGIAAISNDGYNLADDLVAAFKSSGAKAVCLASSDAVYTEKALPALAALKAAGAGPIFFAGRPGEGFQEVELRAAGVDAFLHAGIDVIAALTGAQARIAGSVH